MSTPSSRLISPPPSIVMTEKQTEIWLTGHRNQSVAELVKRVGYYRIEVVVDICIPADRSDDSDEYYRNLRKSLDRSEIVLHLAGRQLGVFSASPIRTVHNDRELIARGFSKYMRPGLFQVGIGQLASLASKQRTLVISGDSEPEAKSRMLIADYLFLMADFRVFHILQNDTIREHEPTESAWFDLGEIDCDRSAIQHHRYH